MAFIAGRSEAVLRELPGKTRRRFSLPTGSSVSCNSPASGIASAIRVSATIRGVRVVEVRQGRTRRADALPLAGFGRPRRAV